MLSIQTLGKFVSVLSELLEMSCDYVVCRILVLALRAGLAGWSSLVRIRLRVLAITCSRSIALLGLGGWQFELSIFEVFECSSCLVFVKTKRFDSMIPNEHAVVVVVVVRARLHSLNVFVLHQIVTILVTDALHLWLLVGLDLLDWAELTQVFRFALSCLVSGKSAVFLRIHKQLGAQHYLMSIDIAHSDRLRPLSSSLKLLHLANKIASSTVTEIFDRLKNGGIEGACNDRVRPIAHVLLLEHLLRLELLLLLLLDLTSNL